MSDINERIAKVKEQIIETKIARHHLGLMEYDEIIDDFEVFITTIESLQEKLDLQTEPLSEVVQTWVDACAVKDAEIESLKAITELSVNAMKQFQSAEKEFHYVWKIQEFATSTLSEIEKLQNG